MSEVPLYYDWPITTQVNLDQIAKLGSVEQGAWRLCQQPRPRLSILGGGFL